MQTPSVVRMYILPFALTFSLYSLSFSPSLVLSLNCSSVLYTTTNSAPLPPPSPSPSPPPLRFFYGNAPPLFIPNRSCWLACLDVSGWLAWVVWWGLAIEHFPRSVDWYSGNCIHLPFPNSIITIQISLQWLPLSRTT